MQPAASSCLSVYYGEWPWREIHLVAASPETGASWYRSLAAVVNGLKTGPHISKIDYWLRCTYVELKRQSSGTVHAVTALGTFAGLRLWRAFKVRKRHEL